MSINDWREPTRIVLRGCKLFVTLNFPAGTNNKVIIGCESEREQDIVYQNALLDKNCSQVRKRKGQLPDYPKADTRNYIMKKSVPRTYVRPGEHQYEDGDRFCQIRHDFQHLEYFREFYARGARKPVDPLEEPLKEVIRLMVKAGLTKGELLSISPASGAIIYRNVFDSTVIVSGDDRFKNSYNGKHLEAEDIEHG